MWARSENKKNIRVGFTHVPCSYLGDVVFAELPPLGTDVRAGEPVGLVESSLAVLYAILVAPIYAIEPPCG